MKKFALLAASVLALAGTANAQVDYNATPTYDVVVTATDITNFTGQTAAVDIRAIDVDSNGDLYFYTVDGDADPNAQLVRVDVSGASPVFTTLATEAQILAAADQGDTAGTGVPNNGITVLSNGNILFSMFEQTDDLLLIENPGASPTITQLYQGDGITNFTVNNAETEAIIFQINNFGATSNDVISVPIAGGSPSTVVAESVVTAATGAGEAGLVAGTTLSNGDLIVWDESFRDGSDRMVRISGGAVTVVGDPANYNPSAGTSGGMEEVASDSDDTVFAWQEFGSDNGLYIFPNPFDDTSAIYFDDATIQAGTGMTDPDVEPATGGIAVFRPNATDAVVYIGQENDPDAKIISLTFAAPAANVDSWEMYN